MTATSWVDIRTPPAAGGPLRLITGYADVWVEAQDLDRAARFYGELLGFGRPILVAEGIRFSLNDLQSLTLVERSNPRSLPRCIRVLLLVNTDVPSSAIRFVYLRGAQLLRATA